jgi:lipase
VETQARRRAKALTVPVRGGDIAAFVWEAAGTTGGPPRTMIAIHGITASHQAWACFAEAFPELRIVALDLRGRGRSNALPAPFGMQQHADDVAAVMDALAIDRATIVGHSMGAFVAVRLAAAHGPRVSGLLLVDGGLPLAPPPGIDRAAAIAASLGPGLARLSMTFATQDAYRDFWRVHPSFVGRWSPFVEAYVDYDLVPTAGGFRPATSPDVVAADGRELFGGDGYEDALARLPRGTTMLTAPRGLLDAEPLYAPAALAEWQKKLPALSIREVPDVNHYTIVMADAGARAVGAEVLRLPS